MLEDYAALRAAGRQPQLRIGPWTHTAPGLAAAGHRDGIAWLRAHLLGDHRLLRRSPVRVKLTGAGGGWRDLDCWPPAGTGERRLWPSTGGELCRPPRHSARRDGGGGDRYRYDPADPTPAVGGPVLLAREPVVDNRELEARADVLTFTDRAAERNGRGARAGLGDAVGAGRAPTTSTCSRASATSTATGRPGTCVTPSHASRPSALSVRGTDPGRSRSRCGRSVTASPPATGSACRSPRVRIRVTRATPAPGEDPATATAVRTVAVELLHDSEHPSVPVLPA